MLLFFFLFSFVFFSLHSPSHSIFLKLIHFWLPSLGIFAAQTTVSYLFELISYFFRGICCCFSNMFFFFFCHSFSFYVIFFLFCYYILFFFFLFSFCLYTHFIHKDLRSTSIQSVLGNAFKLVHFQWRSISSAASVTAVGCYVSNRQLDFH